MSRSKTLYLFLKVVGVAVATALAIGIDKLIEKVKYVLTL